MLKLFQNNLIMDKKNYQSGEKSAQLNYELKSLQSYLKLLLSKGDFFKLSFVTLSLSKILVITPLRTLLHSSLHPSRCSRLFLAVFDHELGRTVIYWKPCVYIWDSWELGHTWFLPHTPPTRGPHGRYLKVSLWLSLSLFTVPKFVNNDSAEWMQMAGQVSRGDHDKRQMSCIMLSNLNR